MANFGEDLRDAIAADARLFVLRELAAQTDGRLNVLSLTRVLDLSGIRRSREWVETQLNKLGELGAVDLVKAGDLTVASITRAGRDHLAERSVLVGVSLPHEAG